MPVPLDDAITAAKAESPPANAYGRATQTNADATALAIDLVSRVSDFYGVLLLNLAVRIVEGV